MLQNATTRTRGMVLFLLGNCPKGLQALLDELTRYLDDAPTAGDPRCTTCINLAVGLAMAFLDDAEWDALEAADSSPQERAAALRCVLAAV